MGCNRELRGELGGRGRSGTPRKLVAVDGAVPKAEGSGNPLIDPALAATGRWAWDAYARIVPKGMQSKRGHVILGTRSDCY